MEKHNNHNKNMKNTSSKHAGKMMKLLTLIRKCLIYHVLQEIQKNRGYFIWITKYTKKDLALKKKKREFNSTTYHTNLKENLILLKI